MRLLVSEAARRRLGDALIGIEAEIATIDSARTIMLNGERLDPGRTRLDALWAAFELFSGEDGRAFLGELVRHTRPAWVHSAAAGYDHPIYADIVRQGVLLTTSHGQALNMAEYVLAGVLDHFQRGPERRAAQAALSWRRFQYREIAGTQWLIIGFGAIGQAVGVRARAFGARVTGVRRDQTPHPSADAIAPLNAVSTLLPDADVVLLSIPLAPATRHLCNGDFLAAMKPGSVLVNIGRGGLVDEAALLRALESGAPAHAVLDVFQTEPLPAESPFWSHPRVSVTAHASPFGDGQEARNDALFLENLRRFMAGETLLNLAAPDDVIGAA
jgi:phosphoglycerate dehydrogenase-like enzyme